ncbi:hypothetical protein LWI28_015722 [Acer negundo]|uniref:FAR1 domain-containing protein n=1 Tax=Acer negundo TaxID=4023 RepID=A0AAD5IQC4_ACENE|nr:hypothetical protein LWI28_015722 [Acer negundo]
METPGGESSVNTNDELNQFQVSPNMDSSVVDFVPYSSLDGTLKETCGLGYKDVIVMKFDLVEDTRAFYHGYSRAVGFGVRLSNKIHDSKGKITSRVWVCEKEGFRHKKYMCNTNSERKPRLQTRVGCKARFSVGLDRDTNKYIVRVFEENHCHKLETFRLGDSKTRSKTKQPEPSTSTVRTLGVDWAAHDKPKLWWAAHGSLVWPYGLRKAAPLWGCGLRTPMGEGRRMSVWLIGHLKILYS